MLLAFVARASESCAMSLVDEATKKFYVKNSVAMKCFFVYIKRIFENNWAFSCVFFIERGGIISDFIK